MARNSGYCRALITAMAISASAGMSARADAEVAASKSLTVQATGPRQGGVGSNFFNVEGKNKERYAGFGVLVFQLPKGDGPAEVKDLTITLVQSIPGFATDGKLEFYLAQPVDDDPGSLQKLRFDPHDTGGVAKDAFKSLHPLGPGAFKKVESGRVDAFNFTPDESVRKELRRLVKAGGRIHIVITPGDNDVAATYYGAGNEAGANRPRIKVRG